MKFLQWKILLYCVNQEDIIRRKKEAKKNIIQADYLQEKEEGKDPNSSGFFYEDRNSSAASIEIDHSLQGPLNPNDSGAILY